jgi:hypothetical protein
MGGFGGGTGGSFACSMGGFGRGTGSLGISSNQLVEFFPAFSFCPEFGNFFFKSLFSLFYTFFLH